MEDLLKAPEHPTCAAIVNCLSDVDDCEKRALGLSSDRREDVGFTSITNEGQWTPYAWSSCSSAESSKFSTERKCSISNAVTAPRALEGGPNER